MARGDKSKSITSDRRKAGRTQARLQGAGVSKRSAEKRAWDQMNKTGRTTPQAGTASGRSKISKRTSNPAGSTRKAKTTGKTRK